MQLDNLHIRIGSRALVEALNLKINRAECWCVIGRNGAGKTTLLRTLAGLHEAETGNINLGERELHKWSLRELAQQRAFLPQGRNDAFAYRVIETVIAARHPYGDSHYWESDADYASAFAALKIMDVETLAQRDVRSLSGGERQRVAIAAILAQDTPLLLLDEPTSALDLAHQISVIALIKRLCESGKTVVMVSHDLNLARSAATHALLLNDGGQWQAGAVDSVMTPALLGHCLGHPIEIMQHGQRSIYIPSEDAL